MPPCPCQVSPKLDFLTKPVAYSDCCQPYHDSLLNDDTATIQAETAERLMRSRYSAFVMLKPDYIVKTTLPAQQDFLDINAIESWARATNWAGLEILEHTAKLGKRHAQVEFKAYFNSPEDKADSLQAHHERSTFLKVKSKADNSERWYFLDPTVEINISQKQPCICGSGEKFKRCCGLYV